MDEAMVGLVEGGEACFLKVGSGVGGGIAHLASTDWKDLKVRAEATFLGRLFHYFQSAMPYGAQDLHC